jgi:hypothetical protein
MDSALGSASGLLATESGRKSLFTKQKMEGRYSKHKRRLNRSRKVLIIVAVLVLVVAANVPVIPVDNVHFYGHVSLSCYYLGFGGVDIYSKFYHLSFAHFQFYCDRFLG